MKTIITTLFFLMSLGITSIAQTDTTFTIGSTTIKFEETSHNFGKIIFASDASYSFEFTNTGNSPLKISHVKSSCGCTIPEWPQEEIAPGQSGIISVKYNTRRSGKFEKGITVYANVISSPIVIKISGEVTHNPNKNKL